MHRIPSFRVSILLIAIWLPQRNGVADMFLVARTHLARYDETTGALLEVFRPSFEGETIERSTIGPDGDIYTSIQRFGGSSVQRFDGRTGQFKDMLTWFDLGLPSAIGFGPDGDLFVAWKQWVNSREEERCSVYRYDAKTATLKSKFIDSNYDIKAIAGMSIGADGKVYMVEDPRGLVVYDGKTADVLRTITPPEDPAFSYDDKLAMAKDQSLYWLHKNVYRVDVETGAFAKTIDLQSAGLTNMSIMAIGPEGDFYLVDRAGDTTRFDGKTGQTKGQWSKHAYFELGNGSGYTGLLFSSPRLSMSQTPLGNMAALRFTDTKDNFVLESTSAIGDAVGWEPVEVTPANKWPDLEIEITTAEAARIFRLRRK